MRPRGGLALTTVPIATLADAIQGLAGVEANDQDQVRINGKANFIVVSTPSEKRATQYAALDYLLVGASRYELATHVPAPSNTSLGVIFNVPETDTAEQIHHSVLAYNQQLKVLDVRRLGSSNMVQILFDGPHVPYWVRYRAATYRCKPLKRKTEACANCWSTGHRKDVCPQQNTVPRCATCGVANAPEGHPCRPKCIVCDGPHATGSAECPRRFQPRARPTYAQAATGRQGPKKQPPHQGEDFPPLQTGQHAPRTQHETGSQSASKTVHQQDGRPQRQQVSGPSASSHLVRNPACMPSSPLSSPNVIQPPSPLTSDIAKELQAMRAEITALRAENAPLKKEITLLRSPQGEMPPHKRRAPNPLDGGALPRPSPPQRSAWSA